MDFPLIALILTQLLSCSVYSILAPFFPSEASSKGIGSSLIGIIFSGYPIAASLSSLIFAKFISKIGRRKLLVFGCACEGFAMIAFGFVPYMSRKLFIVISMIARFCQGLGAGANTTATFAIVAVTYTEKMETTLGLIQSTTGVGFLAGPLIGSALYSIGGFSFLFFTYGIIFLIFVPIIYTMLPKDAEYNKNRDEIQLSELARIPTVIFNGIVQMISIMSMSFLYPTLTTHLASFGVSTAMSGVIFSLPSAAYAVAVIALSFVKLERKLTMSIGLFFISIANFHVGPWEYLFLPQKLWVVIMAGAILGFGLGLASLPVLPDMVENSVKVLRQYTESQVSDSLSGLLCFAIFFGEICGPPLSGFLAESMDFGNAEAVMGFVVLFYMIIYMIYRKKHNSLKSDNLKETLFEHEMILKSKN